LPEQVAALAALAAIGGAEAARCVATIIGRCWVQGPTLAVAVSVAARLGSHLPPQNALALLRHGDPAIRADACRLARRAPDVIDVLIDLLGDLNRNVCIEAACALGRMGQAEALPALKLALRQAPSAGAIEAVTPLADVECVVLLGRLARGLGADLAVAAAAALDAVEHPLARRLLDRQGDT
jgi:HEAT repeat protein